MIPQAAQSSLPVCYLFRRLVVHHHWSTVYCHRWNHQEYQTTSSINHQFINRWPFAAADYDISYSACIILSSESISRLVSSALSFLISFLPCSFSVARSLLSIITELTTFITAYWLPNVFLALMLLTHDISDPKYAYRNDRDTSEWYETVRTQYTSPLVPKCSKNSGIKL